MVSGEDGYLGGVGALAAGDLTVRLGPELFGVSDQIVVPVAVVTSTTVVDASTLGWAINWLTLFALGVYLTPYLFPQSLLSWASGLWARLAVAGGATALGLLVEALYRSALPAGGSPLPVGPSVGTVGGSLVGSAGLLAVAAVLGRAVNPSPFPRPEAAYLALPEGVDRTGPVGLVVRGTLVVVTLAVVFATAAQLYPLTEALVLGVAVYTVAVPADVRAADPVERLSVGAVAAWGRLRHVTALLYLLATLLALTAVAVEALGAFPVVTLLSGGVAGVALLACTLVVPVVHVLKYADRAFRSFAVEIDRGNRPVDLVDPGRAPGFMLHAGALFGLLDLVYVEGRLSGPVPGSVWVAVAVLTVVTLWASYARAPLRAVIPDYHAVPLAVGLWLAAATEVGSPADGYTARLLLGMPVGPGVAVDAAVGALLVVLGVLFVYAPVGALAYETDREAAARDGGDSLGTALWLWGLNTVVWTVGIGALYVMAGFPGSFEALNEWMQANSGDLLAVGPVAFPMGLSFLGAVAYTVIPLLSGRLLPRFEPVD